MARIVLYCQPGARRGPSSPAPTTASQRSAQGAAGRRRANKALIAFLSKLCEVPRSAISIEMGASSRIKRVDVAGLDDEALRAALGL